MRVPRSPAKILLRIVYWLAVLAVSIGILIGLIVFLESRDNSQVGHGARLVVPVHIG